MREAVRLSRESVENGGGPFGAVIVKDGQIVAGSSNSVTLDTDPTAHAEVMAIRDACKNLGTYDLSDCEIYTTCYPCPMCLSAIIWANVKKVYYGNSKEDARKIFDNVLENKATDSQKNVVLANSAFAINCVCPQKNIHDCFLEAKESLESGKALQVFKTYVEMNS